MDPYVPPKSNLQEATTAQSWLSFVFGIILGALGYTTPFCLNALANVQRLGSMPFSAAFAGFGDWHWPPTVTGYLLLVPNVFAMLTLGAIGLTWGSKSVPRATKRMLVGGSCVSLVLVYVYWIAFCFGLPIQPARSQMLNNALYAGITVGIPFMICFAPRCFLRGIPPNEP